MSTTRRHEITTQRQLRAAFWSENPGLERRRIPDHSGNGTMHVTDTRCAFADWLDACSRAGRVSQALAERATLS